MPVKRSSLVLKGCILSQAATFLNGLTTLSRERGRSRGCSYYLIQIRACARTSFPPSISSMGQVPVMRAVIFDMDGVLTDSEPLINAAAIAMFKEKGLVV